ncbi:predicted protein [Chaetoceros tenuissimus]|uniref:Uncharacterized protein n=1 Tax=Chaetoceros tenuissimus TaxID=426638 RepID=A0AAD3DBN0_9STRA|nr:predicted protein [Chaetoceros tenuissimus]
MNLSIMTSNSKAIPSNDAFFLLDPTPLFQTPVSKKRILPSSDPPAVRKVVRPTKLARRSNNTEVPLNMLLPLFDLKSSNETATTFSLKRRRSSEANELEQCFPSSDYYEVNGMKSSNAGDNSSGEYRKRKDATMPSPRVRISTPTIATPMRKKIRTIKNIITP